MAGKMEESGLTENIPLIMHLSHLGPISCIFTTWVSSGLTSSASVVAATADDSDVLCLLLRQTMWDLDCEESWVLKNWCFWTVVLEKTLESPLDCKEIQPVHSEGDQSWMFFGRTDAKAETPVLWPPHAKSWLIGKDPDAGRDWGQEEKGTTEGEMTGWHHRHDGREFEWTPGVGDGQGGLVCCDSWGCKESDTTERLYWTELMADNIPFVITKAEGDP